MRQQAHSSRCRVTPESVLPSAATACDVEGVNVNCYTIEVYRIRANRETNANLEGLTLMPAIAALDTYR